MEELDLLKEIHSAASDLLFAECNPDFASFCGQSPNDLKQVLKQKMKNYEDFIGED